MTDDLSVRTAKAIAEAYDVEVIPAFNRTEAKHGDFTTNVALKLGPQLNKSPIEIAEKIKELLETSSDYEITVAGPGFINVRLRDAELFRKARNSTELPRTLKDKVVVAEYSDPNPFKVLHGGHLYTSLVGDAIANIIEAAGAKVHRVNFGGDVGLHVAKTLWAIIRELGGETPEKLQQVLGDEKLEWVSQRYVQGNQAYEDDPVAKEEIITLNKRIYDLHKSNDKTSGLAQIYWTCRKWSYDGFEKLYERLGMVPFEKYYPESATTQLGVDKVREGTDKGIFQISDRATVFVGEDRGLHTRVFLNSEGLPTYEAKDLGLALTKWNDYKYDKSLIITGNDIQEYMKVIKAAVHEFNPEASERTVHLTHGQIKLAGGVKMSSRLGNILTADDILEAAYEEAGQKFTAADDKIILGAVRYSFLRSRIGSDIIYEPKESVNMEGNSGPYLQYALVRARSIIRKINEAGDTGEVESADGLDDDERSLARSIGLYPEVFENSLFDYSPHHIANYLYELAVSFNRFYENSRVIGHERAKTRAALVRAYEKTLSHGLSVLGMPRPEKM